MFESLEKSYLDVKERKLEIQPNVITADYCMKKLLSDYDDFKDDPASFIYRENSEYIVYNES